MSDFRLNLTLIPLREREQRLEEIVVSTQHCCQGRCHIPLKRTDYAKTTFPFCQNCPLCPLLTNVDCPHSLRVAFLKHISACQLLWKAPEVVLLFLYHSLGLLEIHSSLILMTTIWVPFGKLYNLQVPYNLDFEQWSLHHLTLYNVHVLIRV